MLGKIVEALRDYLGQASGWYHQIATGTGSSWQWDYAMMFEYFFAGVILCIVVSYVFRIILKLFD